MKRTIHTSLLLALALKIVAVPVAAAAPTALTPLAHIEANMRAEASRDETTRVTITLKNAQGKVQERILHWTTVTLANDDKRSLLYFDRPKSIEGTGLLTHENKGKEDERWLYLPALQKTRRISGSDKSDTFMGTDFSYEDLVTEEPENYDYAFAEASDCTGCVAIIATPKNEKEKAESGYAKRVLMLDTTTHMVVAAEYYNKSGTHAKSFRASDFRPVNSAGAIRPFRMEMVDLINQHTTVMAFDGYQIDTGVVADSISLRSLTQVR